MINTGTSKNTEHEDQQILNPSNSMMEIVANSMEVDETSQRARDSDVDTGTLFTLPANAQCTHMGDFILNPNEDGSPSIEFQIFEVKYPDSDRIGNEPASDNGEKGGIWANILNLFRRPKDSPNGDENAGTPSPNNNNDDGQNAGSNKPSSDYGGSGDLGKSPSTSSPIPPSSTYPLFKDCGGLEKQIEYIRTVVIEPLKGNSALQKKFDLKPPRGILFYGPPGTGKTRLAQAIGNELKLALDHTVHFIHRKGNDIASKWFGESSSNLRKVFEEAKRSKPCVIFFDEIDGLCPSRDKSNLTEAYITVVTTFLGLMDELPVGEVFVIGATNMTESIDPAVLRPGRFDKHIEFLPPAEDGRREILRIHTKGWKVKPTEQVLNGIIKKTTGFSGADLNKLCSDAFDIAFSKSLKQQEKTPYSEMQFDNLKVTTEDWHEALNKIKPSTTAVFGSSLYVPDSFKSTSFIEPLIKSDVTKLAKMILDVLNGKENQDRSGEKTVNGKFAKLSSLHIWETSRSIIGTLDDYIIANLFSVSELSDFPKYTINSDQMLSLFHNVWLRKLDSAFKQALASAAHEPTILYIPDVSLFWNTLIHHVPSLAMGLEDLLESLRGSRVLLVTTGSLDPSTLNPENPFNRICIEHGLQYHVVATEEKRRNFIMTVVPEQYRNKAKMNGNQQKTLEDRIDLAVNNTAGMGLGSIVGFYDYLKQKLEINKAAAGQDGPLEFHTLVDCIRDSVNEFDEWLKKLQEKENKNPRR